ncbi:hypothetical protein BJ912DRAFT_928345 [Pholiota molesta]|nr:hypothetical protein BJ912DRAFT_928345 [Pholiota molesta]
MMLISMPLRLDRCICRCPKAIASFKNEVHRNHPKVFIATGNLLPFSQASSSQYFTLGMQKALETRFISTAVQSYQGEDIKFYFATLVSSSGGISIDDFKKSALTHAQVYWKLIDNKEQTDWDHRFTLDGETYHQSHSTT